MLCLIDSIRDDDPSLQRLLSAVEEAHTLTELLLAVWPLTRMIAIHLVESVLAERQWEQLEVEQLPTGVRQGYAGLALSRGTTAASAGMASSGHGL
jgi:hypothetical protein